MLNLLLQDYIFPRFSCTDLIRTFNRTLNFTFALWCALLDTHIKNKKNIQAYITRTLGKQYSECEIRRMNPKLGQQRASLDTVENNFIGQLPGSNNCQETTATCLKGWRLLMRKKQSTKYYHDFNWYCISKPHRFSWRLTRRAFCWGWSSDPSVQKISYRAKTQAEIT